MMRSEGNGLAGSGVLKRLKFFTGLVCILLVSVLVLEIVRLPSFQKQGTAVSQPAAELSIQPDTSDDHWFKVLVYSGTIPLVGMYWLAYNQNFQFIRRSDPLLVWLSLLFVFSIAFLRFPTGLLASYPQHQIAVIIYGANLALSGFVLQLTWWHAVRKSDLSGQNLPQTLISRITRRNISLPLLSLLAIGFSFSSLWASLTLYLLIPVIYFLLSKVILPVTDLLVSNGTEIRLSEEG